VDELSNDPKNLIGQVLNSKYKVLSLLGEGGMGVVYKVQHLLLQKKNIFALKILHPRFSSDSEFHARFLQEVEVTMNLTHESIIQIRDFGKTEGGLLFFTLDYFPGRSLKSVIEENGVLPTSRVINIFRQILLALKEAHRANVIHRDLKPDNVLIAAVPGGQEQVRVLDFGIAKIMEAEDDAGLTQGNLIGTPRYMSPEQAGGDSLDGRSDLYSLGVMVYEMLVGRVPFATGTTRTILMQHMTTAPPAFNVIRPDLDVPFLLERLVFDLLAKEPGGRPASADDVIARLHTEATVREPRVRRRSLRSKTRLATLAVVLLAAGLALEHFLPWRSLFLGEAGAQKWEGSDTPGGQIAPSAVRGSLDGGAVAPGGAGGSPPGRVPFAGSPSTTASPAARPAGAPISAKSLVVGCEVCGGTYRRGEKLGGMCHGLPLLSVD